MVNAEAAITHVVKYKEATTQIALTTLRSVLGQSELTSCWLIGIRSTACCAKSSTNIRNPGVCG